MRSISILFRPAFSDFDAGKVFRQLIVKLKHFFLATISVEKFEERAEELICCCIFCMLTECI